MPKMKTKKSAAKRFRVRPGGTVKRGQAYKRHILTKKSTTRKRHLRGAANVHETHMGPARRDAALRGVEGPLVPHREHQLASRKPRRHSARPPQEDPGPREGLP